MRIVCIVWIACNHLGKDMEEKCTHQRASILASKYTKYVEGNTSVTSVETE